MSWFIIFSIRKVLRLQSAVLRLHVKVIFPSEFNVIFPSEFRKAPPKTGQKNMTNVKMYDYATPNEKHKNAKSILYVYVKVYQRSKYARSMSTLSFEVLGHFSSCPKTRAAGRLRRGCRIHFILLR